MGEISSVQFKERYKFERAMGYTIDIGFKLIDFSSVNIEFGYSEYEFLKFDTYLSECYDSYMNEIRLKMGALSKSDMVGLKHDAKDLILSAEKNIVDVAELARAYHKYNIDGIFHIDLKVTVRFFEQYFQDQLYYLKSFLTALESLTELKEAEVHLKLTQNDSKSLHVLPMNLQVLPMNKNSVIMYGWFMSKIKRWEFNNQTDLAAFLLDNFLYTNGSKHEMEILGGDVAFSKLKQAFSTTSKAYDVFLSDFRSFVDDLTHQEMEILEQIKFPLPKTDNYYNEIDW